MAEVYIPNRDLIKNLCWNTGTSLSPVFTPVCTTSEININTDLETKDWYVNCDALQRRLITGGSVTLAGTMKLDVNNTGEMAMLTSIHTMISSGTIAQFNNQQIKFDLLSSYTGTTLTYTSYIANVNVSFSDLGGAAEDEAEFGFEMTLIGTATTTS